MINASFSYARIALYVGYTPALCHGVQRSSTGMLSGCSMGRAKHLCPYHMSPSVACSSASGVRLAVVGDVHGQWCCSRDAAALNALNADMTLFVGDFGNERVSLVSDIAHLDTPKAVILGNHDAWYTMTARKRSRSCSPSAHYSPHVTAAASMATSNTEPAAASQVDHSSEPDRVQQQLVALGACHIGYGHLQLPGKHISVVGARPFSKGGKSFCTIRNFMSRLYNVADMRESAEKILDVIKMQVPADNALILMGHNGPAGLGTERHSICGVDWVSEAGDHGDPDMAHVLQQLQEAGRRVALVVFGHMHHTLKGGGLRQMVHVDAKSGTAFLNAATVPRVVSNSNQGPPDTAGPSKHHFLVVDMHDGQVHTAANVWVKVTQAGSGADISKNTGAAATDLESGNGNHCHDGKGMQKSQQLVMDQQQHIVLGQWLVQVQEVQEILKTVQEGSAVKYYWDAHSGAWKKVMVGFAEVPAAASLQA